jgi:hypothetical protein
VDEIDGIRRVILSGQVEAAITPRTRLAAGKPCLIVRDGAQTVEFSFVTDIARQPARGAVATTNDVLNVASGRRRVSPTSPALAALWVSICRRVSTGTDGDTGVAAAG